MNPTGIHEDTGTIPDLAQGQGSGLLVSCGVGHRNGSDLAWLWLWCRPAAVAPIQPLAWEVPYAVGLALKSEGEKKGRKEERKHSAC